MSARKVCFYRAQKQPRKEERNEKKKGDQHSVHTYVLCTRMYVCGASHNAATCGLVKCGFGRLKVRVVFGDTSHKILVWVRADEQLVSDGEKYLGINIFHMCLKSKKL